MHRDVCSKCIDSLEAKRYFDVTKRKGAATVIDVIHAPCYRVFGTVTYPEREERKPTTTEKPMVDENGKIVPREKTPKRKCAATNRFGNPCGQYVRTGDYCRSHEWLDEWLTPLAQDQGQLVAQDRGQLFR